ncbi:hypothetical protein WJX73_008490 [Symbiochloris irregularis]|uniref:Translation initiation factor eIF2B subunit alpha n=1 Tax=Symbiochloris irregularis TaxID=706552 RepID=A0AAW1NYU3_9CHLO
MAQRSISQFLDEDEHVRERPPARPSRLSQDRKTHESKAAEDKHPTTLGGATYYRPTGEAVDEVVRDFHEAIVREPDGAVAVAAIKALTGVLKRSTATTMMGVQKELNDAAASLQKCNETAISLKAGCELFLRYATRTTAQDLEDFAAAKARIIERGDHFAQTSTRARQTIAELGARFVRPGFVVLVHGHSRVVLALLRHAASQGIHFSVAVTEGGRDNTGVHMARELEKLKIPIVFILDSAIAYALEALKVNMVLTGAEGVVESGGVINKLGTYTIALAAKALSVPYYVAAESYKFARLYPLGQSDVPVERRKVDMGPLMPSSVRVENPSRDYTPPKYISLLFTDLGVLTPAAVSDELIQLMA